MQQVVHAVERVSHAELAFQNVDEVPAAQRAYAVFIPRSVQHTPLERLVLFDRQPRRTTRRRLRHDRLQTVISVRIAPALHEAARSPEHPHDVQCLLSSDRQLHRPQTITLLGVAGLADQPRQFQCVVGMAKGDVDG